MTTISVIDNTPADSSAADTIKAAFDKVNDNDSYLNGMACGVNNIGTAGGAQNLDLSKSINTITLNANATFTLLPHANSGEIYSSVLLIVNPSTYTVSWADSINWHGGTTPVFNTAGYHAALLMHDSSSGYSGVVLGYSSGGGTDEKAKVSSNDTTAGYLNGKLVAGTNITLTENSDGGNETLTITASGGGGSLTGYTEGAANYSTALGDDAGTSSNMQYCTLIGHDVGATSPTTAHHNYALGFSCFNGLTTGIYNTAMGYNCANTMTTGTYNVTIGANITSAAAIGSNNVYIGVDVASGASTTSSNSNVAIGDTCFRGAGTANLYNVVLGNLTLDNVSGATYNVAIGYEAGRYTSSGDDNVFIGKSAGKGVSGSALTGGGNICIGTLAGAAIITNAVSNTIIGESAGSGVTTGDFNTLIGYNAGDGVTTQSHVVAIGSGAFPTGTPGNYDIYMGGASVAYAAIQVAWTVLSDERSKKDIVDINHGLDFINNLRPVSYRFKNDENNLLHYGLVAQEVEKVLHDSNTALHRIKHGSSYTDEQRLTYEELIAPMIKAIQELTERVKKLEAVNIDA